MFPPATSNAIRLVAAVAVAAVVAAACGGGGAGRESASASPTPAPTPETLRVGTDGSAADDGPTGSADPGGAELPAETADPVGSVRTLFDAIRAGDHALQLAVTTGPARTLMRVRDVIRRENERRGGTTSEVVDVAEEPAVVERSADRAAVSVRATVTSTISGDQGEISSDATIDGPVELLLRDGRWLVSDLVYAGRALRPAHHPVDAAQVRNGIRLEVPVVLSYKETTAVLMRLVNEGSGGVPITISQAVLTAADGTKLDPQQVATEGGERATPTVFVAFPRTEGRPRGLSVTVRNEDTDSSWTYELTF